ncbi:GerMN domain-containing protein [Paenibacillus marinisediminis]
MNHSSHSVSRSQKLRYGAAACIMALSMGLAACGGNSAIDAPPTDVETEMLRAVEDNSAGVSGTSLIHDQTADTNMTVYLKDRNGYLAPVSYKLEAQDSESLAKAGLDLLIEGNPNTATLPLGFSATLPKGTSVKHVTIDPEQKLAVVEFSGQFKQYSAEQERRILESVTWTLTSMKDVQQVQLWMDSQKLTEMPVGGIPLDSNLTRSLGINLEIADNVSYMNSMPVMVYFTSLTLDGKSYYIPVTRLVDPSDDLVKTALEQIIEGPQDKKAMSMVATEGTQIKHAERNGDTVTVELSDNMFEKGDKIPSDLLKSVVLTLTELPDVSKVQITMNGMKDIIGTDDKDYSQPVTRPSVNQASKG